MDTKDFHCWVEGIEDGTANIYLDTFGAEPPEVFYSIFGELKPVVSSSVESTDGGPVYQLVPINFEGEV